MINILIVDQDTRLINELRLYLIELGFHIDETDCIEKAWDILEHKEIDLILCDVFGPDRFEFLQKLRLDQKMCTLPIVLLTSRGLTQDRIIGYKNGCDLYISKPFNVEELVAIIEMLLNRDTLIRLKKQKVNASLFKNNTLLKNSNNSLNIIFTPREQTILHFVGEGLMNKQIAANLNISLRSVEKYISRLLIKTKTRNRAELVKYIFENNLIN